MTRSAPSRGRAVLRSRYAGELWRQYAAQEPLPQLDRWLAAALKKYRKFGSQDRRAYSEILFAMIRFGYLAAFLDFAAQRPAGTADRPAELDAAIAEFSDRYAAPAAAAAVLRRLPVADLLYVAGRRHAGEQADQWPLAELPADDQQQRLAPWFDALEQRLAADDSLPARLLWQGLPLWFTAPLADRAARSGWTAAELDAFLVAQARRPPLWLRLNHPERADEVLQELEANGLQATLCGQAVQARGVRSIYGLEIYRSGAIEVQDWASQQIGDEVAARPGQLVWDACAGGGGKSVQLAAMLANQGMLYASDIRAYKLDEVGRRTSRAGFGNVSTLVWDGGGLPSFGPEVADRQGFDWVLVDAPCSSSGIWRRSPDARFRLSADDLAEQTALQLRLLTNAAAAVQTGGGLVYSTCSWLVEENEAVVERFLGGNPSFRLERMRLHGCPAADADTMFSAVMMKTA